MERLMKAIMLLLMLMLMISACSQQPRPSPTAEPTAITVAKRVTATLAATFTFTSTPTPTSTATPFPTYTPYPTLTAYPTYTPYPTPTATPIAVAPSASADWPSTIRRTADILKGNHTELEAILVGLKAINSSGGSVQKLDLTHDGQDDLLVWYLDPKNQDPNTHGNVLVLTHNGELWHPIFDAVFTAGGNGGAKLLIARDLNNDRQNELAYALTSCGTNVCSTIVQVVIWNGMTFSNFTASDIRLPSLSSATFNDSDGDGVFDMILTGGLLQSIEPGPQRERTDVYRWTENGYALSETLYAATDYLPLTIWEANDALEAGDLVKAIKLYERATTDDSLRPWAQGTTDPALIEGERALLRTFSYFRLIVTYALQQNPQAVEQSLNALQTLYPTSPFRQAGELFIQKWNETTSPVEGCRAVNDFAANNTLSMIDSMNNFGYKSPKFSPETICPLN